MSDYFKGVTFPWQEVTPSDDAIVRRAILPDRCLSGCELTYSGYTLTMAAGSMIVCGRQFKHTAAQNWAITGATSGYARLLLAIDVTKASTEDAFEQIYTDIEFASAIDGFPALRQDDINGAGTIYQAVLCVVALNANGITGIVSSLTKGNLAASDVGAVRKTGDTMTGHLNVPGFAIQADYDWPSFSISNKNNPGVQARMEFYRPGSYMYFAIEDTANGIAENYTLPSLTAAETTWYRILTTKNIGEISSTASASNNYHTAHFAKIGKTVICTLLPKALGSTVQYEETITIPTGYRPSAQTSFPFFSDTAKNAGDSAGKVAITANTNGSLYISATYGFTLAEVSKTIYWVTE